MMTAPFVFEPPKAARKGAPGTASLRLKSTNGKLGRVVWDPVADPRYPQGRPRAVRPYVAATSVSIEATCPTSCTFRGAGCFAESGFTRIVGKKMDEAALFATPDEVAEEEARLIDSAWRLGVPQDGARGGRDLRLHVAGDVPSGRGARMLGAAAERYRKRGGGSVWTFTHRWRSIPRQAFGQTVSVLASCEHPTEVKEARDRGYAAALVVPRFKERRAHALPGLPRGWKLVPCPAETGETNCARCRLCLDRDLVGMKVAIGFAVHGRDAARAVEKLVQLRLGV